MQTHLHKNNKNWEEKKMKKLLTLAMALVFIATVLTACYPAIMNAEMALDEDGSGTRTFVAEILKDGVPNPDDPDDAEKNVSGMFTDPGYFPTGIQAAVDYLNTIRPEALSELTVAEETDRYVVTFTMDFDSIEDFNTKMKTLTADFDWVEEEIVEATFEKVDAGNNQTTITYTEDLSLVNIASLWMSHGLWNSPVEENVFDKEYAQGQYNWEKHYNDDDAFQYAMFFTNEIVIKIGDEEELFPKDSEEIIFSVTVDNPIATPTTEPTMEPSPTEAPDETEPGDTAATKLFVIIAVGALLTVFVARKKLVQVK